MASFSVNGTTNCDVEKLNIKPKAIDIGNAGKAFLKIANIINVRHNP